MLWSLRPINVTDTAASRRESKSKIDVIKDAFEDVVDFFKGDNDEEESVK